MLSQEEVMRMLEERDAVAQASWDAYQEEHNAEMELIAQRVATYLADGGMDYITEAIDDALTRAVQKRQELYVTFSTWKDTHSYSGDARFNQTEEDWSRGEVQIANFAVHETDIIQSNLESDYDAARLLAEAVNSYYLENGWQSVGAVDKVYFQTAGWNSGKYVRGYGFLFDPWNA